MRVLIVSKLNARESYGGSNRAYHLGLHLAEKAVVAHVGPDTGAVGYGQTWSTGSRSVGALAAGVRAALRAFQPDVVFALETRANLACRLAGVGRGAAPLVIGFDSSPAFEWATYLRAGSCPRAHAATRYAAARALERVVLSGRAAVVVVCAFLRDLITRRDGVAHSRVHLVPNGAPPEFLSRPVSEPPSPYAPMGGSRVGLLIAPRHFHSNVLAIRFAGEVARRVRQDAPGFRLVVVGGGPAVADTSQVHYAGFVADVVPYIDFADVCLLPYPADAVCGGARLKAMEYFARARPVLSTREGLRGIDDVTPDVEAVVVPAEIETFEGAMHALLREPERRVALGAAARRLVAHRYDWRTLAARLLAIFEGVV
jgi:glycosyltransferase involved in cell wall biosynthesis